MIKILILFIIISSLNVDICLCSNTEIPSNYKLDNFWNDKLDYCYYQQNNTETNMAASIQMVLKFMGVNDIPNQTKILSEIRILNYTNIQIPLNNRSIPTEINIIGNVDKAFYNLKYNVSKGYPHIALTWYNKTEKSENGILVYRVITGYNETGIFYHDTKDGSNIYLNRNDFSELWKTQHNYLTIQILNTIQKGKLSRFFDWVLQNLDLIGLFIVGFLSEHYYVGRLTVFTNAITLDVFFTEIGFMTWYLKLYLGLGTILGIIGLLFYMDKDSHLPSDYYDLAWLYCSEITALILIVSHFTILK